MEAQYGEQFFKQADALFRGGRYGDALILLEKLNRAYPNTKNVLFPMAMCLTELGRGKEALPICDQLIERFDLPRAKALKSRIREETPTIRTTPAINSNATPGVDMALMNDLFDEPKREPRQPVKSRGFDWKPWAVGVVILIVGALILGWLDARANQILLDYQTQLYIVLGLDFTPAQVESGEIAPEVFFDEYAAAIYQAGEDGIPIPPFPLKAYVPNVIAGIFLLYVSVVLGVYLGLKVQDKLPHNETVDDFKDVALYTLIGMALIPVVVVGWIAAPIIFYRHYELNCGGLVILDAVVLGTVFVFGIVAQIIITITSTMFF